MIKIVPTEFLIELTDRGETMPFLRGGQMSWVWVGHRVKRSDQGRGAEPPINRNFLEFALNIVVFDSTIFPILSKWIEFLHFLRNKFNYFGFHLHFIKNNLQKFFFSIANIEFVIFRYYVHSFYVLYPSGWLAYPTHTGTLFQHNSKGANSTEFL